MYHFYKQNIPTKPIILGKILSCYGIHGWVKLCSFTENLTNIFNYQPWFIKNLGKWQQLELEKWCQRNCSSRHQNSIIKLKGIDDRDTAKLLINNNIIIDSSELPVLEKHVFYWKDLIACQVITTNGYNLGKVVNIIETKSNDVLVIKADKKDIFNIKERLIPFLNNKFIKKVDLSVKKIEVNWDPNF